MSIVHSYSTSCSRMSTRPIFLFVLIFFASIFEKCARLHFSEALGGSSRSWQKYRILLLYRCVFLELHRIIICVESIARVGDR